MAEELDPDIHRQSVSRSIQYSDYSSGEDIQPLTSQSQQQTEDDDDDSSSSSYTTITKQIDENKANTKKRTSAQIQSKLITITTKLSHTDNADSTQPLRNRGQSNSNGTSRTAKKAKLAARWQRLLSANSNESTHKLHTSQTVNKPKKIRCVHDSLPWKHEEKPYKRKQSAPPVQKVLLSPAKTKNKIDSYVGLSPVQIWLKKKEERERNKNNRTHSPKKQVILHELQENNGHISNMKVRPIETRKMDSEEAENLQKQQEQRRRIRIETEKKLQEEQEKQMETEELIRIETERMEAMRLKKAEEERSKQIENEQADKLKAAIAAERKTMHAEEQRRRAESEENYRLHEIEEEEERRKLELKEKRLRKQQILNKIKKEKKRKKEEERKRIEEAKQKEMKANARNVEFDRDKFMELLYNHFVYNDRCIVKGEYLLLYLVQRLDVKMDGMESDKEEVLKQVLIELFGDEVVSEWGYYICLL